MTSKELKLQLCVKPLTKIMFYIIAYVSILSAFPHKRTSKTRLLGRATKRPGPSRWPGFTRAENPRVTRGTARWLVRFVTRVKSAQVNFNSILFPFCLESFFVLRDKQSLTYYSKKRELNLFSFKSSSSDSSFCRSYLPTSIWLRLNGSNRRQLFAICEA